jgi:hypothetical protein
LAVTLLSTPAAVAATFNTTAAAVLVHPGSHAYVGTFVEDCSRSQTTVRAILEPSRTIMGTETLALEMSNTATFSASVTAQGGTLTLHAFGAASATGCIPPGSTIMLIYSPGGMLQSLLVLVGQGVVTSTR